MTKASTATRVVEALSADPNCRVKKQKGKLAELSVIVDDETVFYSRNPWGPRAETVLARVQSHLESAG